MPSVIDISALVLAVIGFCVGLAQYRKAQIWKRREFVASEVQKLYEPGPSQNALKMLDYTLRSIELHPNADSDKKYVRVARGYAAAMLIPHNVDDRPNYGINGAAIRDCFDELLTKLENLQAMVTAKLISKEDLEPYLSYWILRLVESRSEGKSLDRHFHRNIRLFADAYGFEGVQDLCALFGYNFKPRPDDLAALREECVDGKWITYVDKIKRDLKASRKTLKSANNGRKPRTVRARRAARPSR